MTATLIYELAAQAYADGARSLFAAPGVPTTGERSERSERGGRAVSAGDLATRAAALAPISAQFTRSAAEDLAGGTPAERLQASIGLLAKAATDLEISALLLQAAEDEAAPTPSAPRAAAPTRGIAIGPAPADLEENLRLLTGAAPAVALRRAAIIPASVPDAQAQLAQLAEDTLKTMRDRTAKAAQSSLGGLLGMSAGELAHAAGIVGMDIATALGQAERVGQLVGLVREFLTNAFASLAALIGPGMAQTAAKEAVAWVQEAVNGEKFANLLERLYGTAKTGQALRGEITASQADLIHFFIAIQGVEALDAAFRQQIGLAEKVLRSLRWFGGIPAAALPYGRVLLAAAYLLLGSYLVLAGADFVDAQNLKLLDRTPGVRRVVEQSLA